MKNRKQNDRKKNPYWIFAGIMLVFIGTNIAVFSQATFSWFIKSQRILNPKASFYENWKTPPLPMSFKVYFFNWTNPEDLENLQIKPKFVEVGPYSFKQTREKVAITWNENNTVTYKLKKKWYFEEEGSSGSLNDQITTLDPVARSVAYYAKDWGFFGKKGISLYLSNLASEISVQKSVEELLFKGYESLLLQLSRSVAVGLEGPAIDKFGYYYGRNDSSDAEGVFNVATGDGDIEMGKILNWKYKTQTSYYPDECGRVHGYVKGDILPSDCPKTFLDIFSAEQGRVYKLDFIQEVSVENIKAYKFVSGENILDNGTKFPQNKCYCKGDCLPSGSMNSIYDVSGIPLFMSYPHFLDADHVYSNAIEGMEPDSSKHEIYVSVEPKTGIALEGATRMQINILLEPDKYITMYNNVPKILIPVFWFEEKATIPPHLALLLSSFLSVPKYAVIAGAFIAVVGLFVTLYNMFRPMPEVTKHTKFLRTKSKPKIKEEVSLKIDA